MQHAARADEMKMNSEGAHEANTERENETNAAQALLLAASIY
jgi:hypothetical protein